MSISHALTLGFTPSRSLPIRLGSSPFRHSLPDGKDAAHLCSTDVYLGYGMGRGVTSTCDVLSSCAKSVALFLFHPKKATRKETCRVFSFVAMGSGMMCLIFLTYIILSHRGGLIISTKFKSALVSCCTSKPLVCLFNIPNEKHGMMTHEY